MEIIVSTAKIANCTKKHYASLQLKKTRMWANAQRDGRPAEYTVGGALCLMPQSLADAQYWSAVQ